MKECFELGFPSRAREGTRCPERLAGGTRHLLCNLAPFSAAPPLVFLRLRSCLSLCPDICSGERCREVDKGGKKFSPQGPNPVGG